ENAAADEAFLQRGLAQAGAARCDAVLRDKAAVDSIRGIKMLISSAQWRRAREDMEGFSAKHPQASDGVKKQLERVKALFESKRPASCGERSGKEVVEILKKGIQAKCTKVGGVDPTFGDVMAWSRKDATDKAFEELLHRFQQVDDQVTAGNVKD